MKKLITKKMKIKTLENRVKRLMICTARKKFKHCLTNCFHGTPHEKESERDACHLKSEICKIQPGIVRTTCRHLNMQEKKEWIKKEMSV